MKIDAGNITASAHVTLTIEVKVESASTWGAGVSIEEIHKQAGEEAIKFLRNSLAGASASFTIVDEPKVDTVLVNTKTH